MNPPSESPTYKGEIPARGATAPPERSDAPLADEELVRRMANGDEHALGALYDRQVTRVHSLAVHLLGDPDDAEDVVEETFWQAWRQAARYDATRGMVSTWLCAIARSRALDLLRSGRRRVERAASPLDSDSGERAAVASGDSPQVGAERDERRLRVQAALDELPAEQREAIELAYFGGLSQSEIAERTGEPLGTVKTRIRLALAKLRARLSTLHEGAR